jgi:hypothetical protein
MKPTQKKKLVGQVLHELQTEQVIKATMHRAFPGFNLGWLRSLVFHSR